MYRVFAIILVFWLPLQPLYAVTSQSCASHVQGTHESNGASVTAPHFSEQAGQLQHAGHDPAHEPGADAWHISFGASTDCVDHTPHAMDGCCHVFVSIPAGMVSLVQLQPDSIMHSSLGMIALTHMSSGLFRPPRPIPA